MTDKPVKIFSLSTCSHCKAAKKFLGDCEIKYEFIDVDQLEGEDREKTIDEIKKWNPKCTFPTLVVNDESCIVGYKEDKIKEAIGE